MKNQDYKNYIRFIPWVAFFLVSLPLFFLFGSLGLLYQILISGVTGVAVFGILTFLLQSFIKTPESIEITKRREDRQAKAKEVFNTAFQDGLDFVIKDEAAKVGKEAGEKYGRERVHELTKSLSPSGSRGKDIAKKIGKGLMQAGKNAAVNMERGNKGITFQNPLKAIEDDFYRMNRKKKE